MARKIFCPRELVVLNDLQRNKYLDVRQYEQADEIQPIGVECATLVTNLSGKLDAQWHKHQSELQDTFRKDLVAIYGFVDAGYHWCPVNGEHVPHVIVAHLVPHHLSYAAIGLMFAGDFQKGRNICWDGCNELLLANHVAESIR